MLDRITFEVCVDSVESVVAAEQGGADRVELCSDLLEGGLTSSYGALRVARARAQLGIMAMIRPRGGDCCYSEAEFETMRADLAMARDSGANGIVLGLLNPDGTVDRVRTARLVELARPLPVTFHRAFDMTRDPVEALEALVDLGIDRVLTSGQEPSVIEGLDLIADLVRRAAGRIIVMPGGGITARNVARVIAGTGAREFHFAALSPVDGRMRYRNPRVFMGGTLRPPEYSLEGTSAADVEAVISSARS